MRKITWNILLCSILLFCSSCTTEQWEIQEKINPEVININEKKQTISIKYNLGPIPILDDLKIEDDPSFVYLSKSKGHLNINLLVKYSSANPNSAYFYYYYGSKQICATKPVDFQHLARFHQDIPEFKWIIKDHERIVNEADEANANSPTFMFEPKEIEKKEDIKVQPTIKQPPDINKEINKVL